MIKSSSGAIHIKNYVAPLGLNELYYYKNYKYIVPLGLYIG